MVLAHFGVAVALFGMAADAAFTTERLVAASRRVIRSRSVPWQVPARTSRPVAGPNWTRWRRYSGALQGGKQRTASPGALVSGRRRRAPAKARWSTRWNGQLYAVLGEQAEDGRWQLRLWWKPFVTMIWYGGLLIALGGLLALIGRVAAICAAFRAREDRIPSRKAGPMSEPRPARFALAAVAAAAGLRRIRWRWSPMACAIRPREVRSALIGKPVPEFNLPPALDGQPGLARADLGGKAALLNIFRQLVRALRG
jgi:hypothetical protein